MGGRARVGSEGWSTERCETAGPGLRNSERRTPAGKRCLEEARMGSVLGRGRARSAAYRDIREHSRPADDDAMAPLSPRPFHKWFVFLPARVWPSPLRQRIQMHGPIHRLIQIHLEHRLRRFRHRDFPHDGLHLAVHRARQEPYVAVAQHLHRPQRRAV
jgi:hypothetical protein